jgi:hypothetical protein
LLQFGPADRLQIAGGNSQQLVLRPKLIEQCGNSRANFRAEIGEVSLDFRAHEGDYVGYAVPPGRFGHGGCLKVCAQYSHIGVAVYGNAIEPEIEAEEMLDGAMESVVVNGIAAVEQGAVDVEQISVGGAPVETGTYVALASRTGRGSSSAARPSRLQRCTSVRISSAFT